MYNDVTISALIVGIDTRITVSAAGTGAAVTVIYTITPS